MTRRSSSYLLGYHGCDRTTARAILLDGKDFIASDKHYDWLGPGAYFWENDPVRAFEWAKDRVRQGKAEDCFVIGALIDRGNCLDLTLRENVPLLEAAYEDLKNSFVELGKPLPENKNPKQGGEDDKLLRFLDCAVIRRLHSLFPKDGPEAFDTVRGMFPEGAPVYPGARFMKHTHTQIAVRNPRSVVEVFVPRALVLGHGMKPLG